MPSSDVPLIRPIASCGVAVVIGASLQGVVSAAIDRIYAQKVEMSEPKSDFLRAMTARGFMHQCTAFDALDEKAASGKPMTAYIGFDCTADSLHVGSLVQIMMLRQLQMSGHKPIVLMGGGTTKIGDPSGKDEARQLVTPEIISKNMAGILRVFKKFLTFGDGPTDAIMVDNADWLDSLEYRSILIIL
jgi:tyrosyl-tRNA synthetase